MALRETGTSEKFSMRPVFDHHFSAAVLADLFGLFVSDLNFLQVGLRLADRFIEIRVEILDDRLPFHAAFRDSVQKSFELGCESRVHNGGKRALHHGIDDFAEFGHVKVLVLFDDIVPCEDRGDRRRVSAGTADSLFLQSLY